MEQEEILEAVKLILARYIKENRMRNTPERNAILELFYKKGGMHSADEVYDIMSESFRVSRATIYNNVELFYSLGLLIKHEEGTAVKYEAENVTTSRPSAHVVEKSLAFRRPTSPTPSTTSNTAVSILSKLSQPSMASAHLASRKPPG